MCLFLNVEELNKNNEKNLSFRFFFGELLIIINEEVISIDFIKYFKKIKSLSKEQ